MWWLSRSMNQKRQFDGYFCTIFSRFYGVLFSYPITQLSFFVHRTLSQEKSKVMSTLFFSVFDWSIKAMQSDIVIKLGRYHRMFSHTGTHNRCRKSLLIQVIAEADLWYGEPGIWKRHKWVHLTIPENTGCYKEIRPIC